MLFFKPNEINSDECSASFDALDGDKSLGTCCLLIKDNIADIFSLELLTDDASIGEGLFRTAYNYAANKGVYMGCCTAENAQCVIKRMSFEQKDGVYINDIPTLLTGSCGEFDK